EALDIEALISGAKKLAPHLGYSLYPLIRTIRSAT
ncbi:spermidine synthase, partial [Pseudomonas syringae pv. tagetis]